MNTQKLADLRGRLNQLRADYIKIVGGSSNEFLDEVLQQLFVLHVQKSLTSPEKQSIEYYKLLIIYVRAYKTPSQTVSLSNSDFIVSKWSCFQTMTTDLENDGLFKSS